MSLLYQYVQKSRETVGVNYLMLCRTSQDYEQPAYIALPLRPTEKSPVGAMAADFECKKPSFHCISSSSVYVRVHRFVLVPILYHSLAARPRAPARRESAGRTTQLQRMRT